MTYAMPSNINGFADLMIYGNQVTNYQLGNLIIISFALVLFFSMKNYTIDRAFVISVFGSFIVSSLFATIGIIAVNIPIVFLVLSIIGMIWTWTQSS